jgi:hypothetical protein
LNTTLTPHSIIHGDACFAYFNKIWGIPSIISKMTLVFLPRLSDLASTLCLQPQCSKSFGDVETTSDHLGSFWSDISDKRVAPTRKSQ